MSFFSISIYKWIETLGDGHYYVWAWLAMGAQPKHYFWVFPDYTSISVSGLSKIDALPNVGGHRPTYVVPE